MNTSIISETAAYAAQVRAALADLPSDEVEELTEGLEADLAESWVENGGPLAIDPAAYAQELRQAAGLPAAGRKRNSFTNIWTSLGDSLRDANAAIRKNPAGEWLLDFLVSLRPAWWILRGYAAYCLFAAVILGMNFFAPTTPLSFVSLAVFIAGSIWVGTRKWNRAMRVLIVVGNIFAVYILLLAIESMLFSLSNAQTYEEIDDRMAGGLLLDGVQVENLFAYDENGQLIALVQLFDQEGNPVDTDAEGRTACLEHSEPTQVSDDEETCTDAMWLPNQLETGAQAWNVFPLNMIERDPDAYSRPLPGAKLVESAPPFVKVPALGATEQTQAETEGEKSGKGGKRD